MGLLQSVMGLEEGKEGSKKLVTMMKKGEIGIDKLFAFLDLVAKRAKETGAYDLAINGKTAAETRMANSYDLFAQAFGKMFNQEIQAPFKGLENLFTRMTKWIDEQEKLTKETGQIGKFETFVDYLTASLGDVADTLMMIVEGLGGLLDKVGVDFNLGKRLAVRDLENSYYASKGASSYGDKASLSSQGMPGFEQYKRDMFFKSQPNATEDDYRRFSTNLFGAASPSGVVGTVGNVLLNLPALGSISNPQNIVRTMESVSSIGPALMKTMDSLLQSQKETAQALLDAKYNNPIINIDGAQDPILIGNIVRDVIKEQTQIGR